MKRKTSGQLGPLVPPNVGQNYYSLRLITRDDSPLRLILNAAVRLVACSEDHDSPRIRIRSTPFRDVPCPDFFTTAGFTVADSNELECAVTANDLANLNPAELRDVTYHDPTPSRRRPPQLVRLTTTSPRPANERGIRTAVLVGIGRLA